jgi:TolB protein
MNITHMRSSPASFLIVSAAGFAGLFLGACSETEVAHPAPAPAAPPSTTTTASSANTARAADLDFANMELPPVFPVAGSDPVVGNAANPPKSFAPAGNPAPGMALDVMESLAQVTFAKQGSDFDPCVSRDGNLVVFASTQHRPTSDIYIKSVNGRTVTQLTADPAQDVMPALSPDGSRVAFASNRAGSWDIYVMSVTGGQAVQVTSDPAQELHPSWSPDGSSIVYSRLGQVSGRWEMWVTNVDQPMAAEFIGYGLFPTWCPIAGTGDNGRDKIVYQRSRERGDRAFSVWTVDYKPGDASSPTEIASNPAAACINPAWSPDGNWIVFATVPFSGNQPSSNFHPGVADLWMCAIDGSGRVNLTTGRSVNLMPSWGADSRIYFVSDRGGIENIWSIGTEKALLAATGGHPTGVQNAAVHPQTRVQPHAQPRPQPQMAHGQPPVTKKPPTELSTVPDNHTEKPGH